MASNNGTKPENNCCDITRAEDKTDMFLKILVFNLGLKCFVDNYWM